MIAQRNGRSSEHPLSAYLPRPKNHRHRDARVGAVLLALSAAMALQAFQHPMDVIWKFTPQDIARAAIVPAFAGAGFMLAAIFVRNGRT